MACAPHYALDAIELPNGGDAIVPAHLATDAGNQTSFQLNPATCSEAGRS
jgi:hypothetical protein